MRTECCPGPMNRREFLRIGALGMGGLTLADVLAARAASGNRGHETSVIMLYLHGGPSHLETYDLKPDAPSSYASIYRPIPTAVPGMEICELFPLQAKLADKFSLIRSLHHDVGIHSDGGIVVLTGKRPSQLDPTSSSKSEHPDFGHVASRIRGVGADAVPPYVAVPRAVYMTLPAYLGVRHKAFETGDPHAADYAPPQLALTAGRDVQALDDRRNLIQQLDRLRGDLDLREEMHGTDEFRELAFQMLTSPQASAAFDVAQEDPDLRDRYGRNQWGQACLLARRLTEAGSAVVNIYFDTPLVGQEFTNWDDHIGNAGRPGHFGRYMSIRLPYMDQALATLIEDLHARGLDRKVLVVAVGEFGRTPRLSHNANGTGRDHWPQAYSALVAGGGLRMGQVIGATNSKGEFPVERPYTPQDLLATIYRHLGIDPSRTLKDYSGRPIHILESGAPIRELL